MAVLAEYWRHRLVKQRKVEVRDINEFEFGVLAFSRNLVSSLGDGLGLSPWPRTPHDDTDFNHDAPLREKPIRVRSPDSF
jgi:hypothetical protein